MTLLAVTVGAIVAAAAAVSGADACEGTIDGVCLSLVRTLAERVGVATALGTAIVALTTVGLMRTEGQWKRGRDLPHDPSP